MMKYFEKNIIGCIVLKVCLSPMMKPYFGGVYCSKGTKKAPVIRPGLMFNELLAIYSCSQSNPAQDIPLSAD